MRFLSLPTYTAISGSAAALAISYAVQKTLASPEEEDYFIAVLSTIFREKLCVLALVNMAYTGLVWFARVIQHLFFGELRVVESQAWIVRMHMYDRLLNYLVFKILFVGAVLEPDLKELVVWATWFSLIGFLRVFSMLARDRFEYLTFSPTTPLRTHIRILSLLVFIQVVNVCWLGLCVYVFAPAGWSVVFLLAFECVTLFLDTMQTIIKYAIHLRDIGHDGQWESRGAILYYSEFLTDTAVLVCTFVHYLHVMALHGIGFTLIDAVLFLNMRTVYSSLQKKIKGFINYRKAARNLDTQYPTATDEEVKQYADTCAICRDEMQSAKRLPCGHLFHLACLRAWVEHHGSCPTCRHSLLSNENEVGSRTANSLAPLPSEPANQMLGAENATRRALGVGLVPPEHRGADWASEQELLRFPFSAPTNDAQPLPPNPTAAAPALAINDNVQRERTGFFDWLMALMGSDTDRRPPPVHVVNQLHDMFPHVPREAIVEDLIATGSADLTADNIIEGRINLNVPRFPLPQPQGYANTPIETEAPSPPSPPQASQPIPSASDINTNASVDPSVSPTPRPSRPVSPKPPPEPVIYCDAELDACLTKAAAGPTIGTDHVLWAAKKRALETARRRYLQKRAEEKARRRAAEDEARDLNNNPVFDAVPDSSLFQIMDPDYSE